MFPLILLALLNFAVSIAADCVPTGTTGCINGNSFNTTEQFLCGSMQNGRQPLYYYDQSGCCAQGIPFDIKTQYCCYDGVHNDNAGYCSTWQWNAKNPSCYDCSAGRRKTTAQMTAQADAAKDEAIGVAEDEAAASVQEEVAVSAIAPVNTKVPASPPQCTTADSQYGCVNGYKYLFSQQYPCVDWLLDYSSNGCCNGNYYSYSADSCCLINGEYKVIYGNAHYCSCTQFGCTP